MHKVWQANTRYELHHVQRMQLVVFGGTAELNG